MKVYVGQIEELLFRVNNLHFSGKQTTEVIVLFPKVALGLMK